MNRICYFLFWIVLFGFFLLSFNSCTKRMLQEENENVVKKMGSDEWDAAGLAEEDLEEAREEVAELRKREDIELSMIYFDYDDYSLSDQAKETLTNNAAWLLKNPQKKVVIEGHCDERGTEEYNLALGERRAMSARRYLMNLGVRGTQLSTISYGEERPADPASGEDAWSKNRRAEFVM